MFPCFQIPTDRLIRRDLFTLSLLVRILSQCIVLLYCCFLSLSRV